MPDRQLPYLPFPDFLAGLDVLAADPPRMVNNACWSDVSGLESKASLLCAALRFLELISPTGESLPALLKVINRNTRSAALADSLQTAYPFVKVQDLQTMPLHRLKKIFREQMQGTTSMWRKALSFYLKAAAEAHLKLHPRLEPRAPRGRRVRAEPARNDATPHPIFPIATVLLEAGGTVQLVLTHQSFDQLTPSELQLVSAAALLLKRRKPPRSEQRYPKAVTRKAD